MRRKRRCGWGRGQKAEGSTPVGRARGSGDEEGRGSVAWHAGLQTACGVGPSKGRVFVKD